MLKSETRQLPLSYQERSMRKSVELDYMLENAVAVALGVAKPHQEFPRKIRVSRRKSSRQTLRASAPSHREHVRAAA